MILGVEKLAQDLLGTRDPFRGGAACVRELISI
jgi:hypothetical protein